MAGMLLLALDGQLSALAAEAVAGVTPMALYRMGL
jgi:hypothetical protein